VKATSTFGVAFFMYLENEIFVTWEKSGGFVRDVQKNF